jgi:hypothetical protein
MRKGWKRHVYPEGTRVGTLEELHELQRGAQTIHENAYCQLRCFIWCAEQAGLPKLRRDVLGVILEFVLGEDILYLLIGSSLQSINTRTGATAVLARLPLESSKLFQHSQFQLVALSSGVELVALASCTTRMKTRDYVTNTTAFVYHIAENEWEAVENVYPTDVLEQDLKKQGQLTSQVYKNVLIICGKGGDVAIDAVTLERLPLGQRPNADLLVNCTSCLVGSYLVMYSSAAVCSSRSGGKCAKECCVALQAIDLELVHQRKVSLFVYNMFSF